MLVSQQATGVSLFVPQLALPDRIHSLLTRRKLFKILPTTLKLKGPVLPRVTVPWMPGHVRRVLALDLPGRDFIEECVYLGQEVGGVYAGGDVTA